MEVDGRRWHSGRRPETRDRRRDHALVLDGKRVLRFTWEDVVKQSSNNRQTSLRSSVRRSA
ncbi:MAG: hypothetical protein ACRDK3_16905 [Actinomycetota bacterium]